MVPNVKKLLICLSFSVFSSSVTAATTCPGKVTEIMEWSAMWDGNLAYRVDSTGSSWLCTISDKSGSMVLAAFASGKTIEPRLNADISCSDVEQYHVPMYLKLLDQ